MPNRVILLSGLGAARLMVRLKFKNSHYLFYNTNVDYKD